MLTLGHFSYKPVHSSEESLILKGPWSPPASMLESDSQGGSESAQVHQGVAPGRPRDTAG